MKETSEKIGIFGGSFDPVHFGHIGLAIAIKEAHDLSQVLFCPAQCNPHKHLNHPTATMEQRIEMLHLALSDVPGCYVSDIESKRPGPSYTIDTIRILQAEEKGKPFPKQYYLIIGDDAIAGFPHWHQPREILALVPVLIGCRSVQPFPFEHIQEEPEICKALQKGMTQTPILEVSSTEVRQRLALGKYCGHLVPAKVIDYIHAHHIY